MNMHTPCHQTYCSHFAAALRCLFLSVVFSVLCAASVQAQSSSKGISNASAEPVWIKMMDDPNANYYDAMDAYNSYWKEHALPASEEEEGLEGGMDFKEHQKEINKEIKKDKDKKLSSEELKYQNENVVMKYQVKRFKQWAREIKPFVQEDGRILTEKERTDIWNKQQEEIKKLQK